MTETQQHLARIEALAATAASATSRRSVFGVLTPGVAAALAHAVKLMRAEEVQLRRGWGVVQTLECWQVVIKHGSEVIGLVPVILRDTPADAILAADAWVRENVDPKPKGD